jgi:hypothetical protein
MHGVKKPRAALAAYEASKANPAYRCPVCGVANENAYIRCNQPDCPDGRDSRPLQRCYMANCDHVCAGDVRALAAYEASKGTATGARYQHLKTGGLYEALNRYRYATEWAAAESWDNTEEVRARFEWARALDPCGILSTGDLAHIGQDFLRHPTS